MATHAKLDLPWWKKHRQPCLSKSAVDKALADFAKANRSLQTSGDAIGYFKAIGGLKSAISKDQQTARRAKDKDAISLLAEMEKLVHAATKSREGHLTPNATFATSGLTKVGPVRVEPSRSAADFNDVIVNNGDRAWQLMKGNNAVSAAKSKSCQAVPKKAAKSLADWKTEKLTWSCMLKSVTNVSVAALKFQLEYQWNGQASSTNGVYLKDYRIWVVDSRIVWGYTLNVDANVTGKPLNSGTRTSAVGAIAVNVKVQVSTPLDKLEKSWTITCHGNKRRDVK